MAIKQIKDLTSATLTDSNWMPHETTAGSSYRIAVSDFRKTLFAAPAAGDIIYNNGTDWVRLASPAAGFVLTSVGTASPPAWSTVATAATWQGTITGVSNYLGTPVVYVGNYMRMGAIVTASVSFDTQAATAATRVNVGISLPVASDFTSAVQCNGAVNFNAVAAADTAGAVLADITNNRADVYWIAGGTSNRTYRCLFQYLIL